jgi:putative membrane protein
MAWALSGALVGWFLLKGWHDKELRQLRTTQEKGQTSV